MQKYLLTEEEILKRYPKSNLHGININRICFRISQLKNLLQIMNKDFYFHFTDLCESQLKFKKGTSLDFYDVYNLMLETRNKINCDKKSNQPGFVNICVNSKEDEKFDNKLETKIEDVGNKNIFIFCFSSKKIENER